MRILIDGFFLKKPRGLGRYVRELAHALSRVDGGALQVQVLVPRDTPTDLFVSPDVIQYRRCLSLPFPIWEQALMPAMIRRLRPDVAHFCYNTGPLLPPSEPTRVVVTIHDLIFTRSNDGGSLYNSVGNAYRNFVFRRMPLDRYAAVAVSETTADEVAAGWGIRPSVVHTSVDLFAAGIDRTAGPPIAVPYLLHVGGNSPRKNTERTIAAFLAAAPEDHRLVILGVAAESPLATRYASGRVIFPGWLSEAEVAAFYRHAKAVLFASLGEGFGLPILEAFHFGTPVVTSNIEPMSRIAGDSALLVDPLDGAAFAAAVGRILDPAVRETLLTRSASVLSRYSADAMAGKMLAVYRDACRRQPSLDRPARGTADRKPPVPVESRADGLTPFSDGRGT